MLSVTFHAVYALVLWCTVIANAKNSLMAQNYLLILISFLIIQFSIIIWFLSFNRELV